jgi:hypothetical protein
MFSRLFGRGPEDPLLARLSDLPVPQAAAGTFVEGFESETQQTKLTKAEGADRKNGVVAQYALQWNLPVAVFNAQVAANDETPLLQWVRQLVVLMTDAEAAARWFAVKTAEVKGYEDRRVGRSHYGKVTFAPVVSVGDEANLFLLPNTDGVLPFHDTQVNFRVGRLVGSASASAIFNDPKIEPQMTALAELLARRIEEALRSPA